MKGHERDPAVDAAWHAQSTELPPPSVDAAILAAAHREVASRPSAAGDNDTLAEAREPSRWWWGLAAAATIGAIAFGVVQLSPFGSRNDPTRATDMPSAERAARPAVEPAPATAEAPRFKPQDAPDATAGLARLEAPVREQPQAARAPAPAARRAPAPVPPPQVESAAVPPAATPQPFPLAVAPPAAPAAASAPTSKQEGATLAARERAAEPMAKRALPAADTARLAAANAGTERTVAPRPAEDFVLRIRELHEAGRLDEAARELVAFRNAYPDADAKLPPALRAWAATIQK